MDLFRKQAMASFSRFYEELTQNHNGHTAKDISMAVYNLLMNFDVPKTFLVGRRTVKPGGSYWCA